jgi:hypothetical protein
MELVRKSGIEYSLVLRARPDHLFIEPLDLRHFAVEHSERPNVKRARGHFISVAERAPQVASLHVANLSSP